MKLPMPRLRRRRAQHVPDPVVAAAIAIALLLAGCASTHGLAPQGTLPDADTLATQRSLRGDANASFPGLAWWQAFGDPQLDALVDEALAGSPDLQAADARARM